MIRYIAARLGAAVLILVALSLLVFFMVRLIPGDPTSNFLDTNTATPEQITALREQLGLDRPWFEQYLTWVVGLLSGNMGKSLTQPVMIADQLSRRLPLTLELALLATVLSIVVGFTIGIIAAVRRGKTADIVIRAASFLLIAAPTFVVATFVVLINVKTAGLPIVAYQSWDENPVAHVGSLLVPAVIVGLPMGAVLARYVRNSLLDTLSQEYVRTARAKGASPRRLVLRHGLRNALIPVVTMIGAQLALLIGGTIVIENVFVLPGMGSALISAINTTDYPTIQTLIVVLGATYVFINLLVDLSYPLIDPRVRLVSK